MRGEEAGRRVPQTKRVDKGADPIARTALRRGRSSTNGHRSMPPREDRPTIRPQPQRRRGEGLPCDPAAQRRGKVITFATEVFLETAWR